MFQIPMIGEPLLIEQTNSFCQHNKLPQVIQSVIHQHPAIRLQEMSRLRKLGERHYRTCHECNEHICACLWCKYDCKPPPPPPELNERTVSKLKPTSMVREHKVVKKNGWRFRNQIVDKFRESFLCQRNRDNKLVQSKESVVWLMKPTKKLRESETNILNPEKPKKLHQTATFHKFHIQTPSVGNLTSQTALYNWPAQLDRQKAANEQIAIQKGTKDYFNKCKKMNQIKLMESQLEKALYCVNHHLKIVNAKPTQQCLSYTKIKELNSLEKIFEQQENNFMRRSQSFDSVDFFEEMLGTYSGNSALESFGEESSTVKCNCEQCKRASNLERQLEETSCEETIQEMASSSTSENNATYHVCNSGNICDYMWLKRTDTQIKLTNQPEEEEGVQISTQTSNVVAAQENVSRTSMNVNFTESCTRMEDFESELGLNEESELAKEALCGKEGAITKELKAPLEEKELTSVTKIDDEQASTSKSKKVLTKKHKHRKFKSIHAKKQRTQASSNTASKSAKKALKSIENAKETASNAVDSSISSDLSKSQLDSIDDSSMDLSAEQSEDVSEKDAYEGLQGTTKQSIQGKSYNICYHKPIKCVKKRNCDVYSSKCDEN